ncbi:hypothetical protein PM082_016843 [Marasmius tenuissimus]|nr:hypothetical protein PM082_016843 [Marasmius tenuissimus]
MYKVQGVSEVQQGNSAETGDGTTPNEIQMLHDWYTEGLVKLNCFTPIPGETVTLVGYGVQSKREILQTVLQFESLFRPQHAQSIGRLLPLVHSNLSLVHRCHQH